MRADSCRRILSRSRRKGIDLVRVPNSRELTASLEQLIDELAAVEHERWAHWQRYVHRQATQQSDGSLRLPADLVARWERQIATKYSELTENEKESDRDQVRKYMPLIEAFIKRLINDSEQGPRTSPKYRG